MLRERTVPAEAVAAPAAPIRKVAWTGRVFAKTIRDQRRALRWWILGVIAVPLMYLAVWPTMRENAAGFDDMFRRMPDVFRNLVGDDFTTPAGYLRAELFAFLGPILLVVAAIGAGARATAADERGGTLDLLLSGPVRRRSVLIHKAGAMLAVLTLLTGTMAITVIALGPVFGLNLDVSNLIAMTTHLLLFALAFGMVALAAGAATGRRGAAVGVTGGLAVLSFVLYTVAPSIAVLEPLRVASPYFFYLGHNPIVRGAHWGDLAVLASIAAAALAFAIVTFERRDLAT